MKHLLTTLSCLAFLLSNCTDTAVPPEEDMLYRMECFYQQERDSALAILDTLRLDRLSRKERAHYNLLWVRANEPYWNAKPQTDSLLNEALQYFSNSDDKYFETIAIMFTARLERLNGKMSESVAHELHALQVIEQCKKVDERLVLYSDKPTDTQNEIDRIRYAITARLGLGYMSCSFWDEGMSLLHKANAYYTKRQNPQLQIFTLIPMGMGYSAKKDFDSAYCCYSQALRLSAETHDNFNHFMNCDAMAQHYLHLYDNHCFENEEEMKGLLLNAIHWHKTELDTLATLGEAMFSSMSASAFDGIASAYCELQQYDSAIYYSKKVIDYQPNNNEKEHARLILYKSYLALGDYENAVLYADDYIKNLDLNGYVEMERGVNLVKSENEKRDELRRLQNESKLRQLRLYVALLLLLAALMALFFIYYRYKKNKELDTLRLLNERQQLQADLEHKRLLSHETLVARAKQTYYKSGEDSKGKVFGIIMADFNAQYPGAVKKLKEAYPDFSDSEIHILVLWSLSFQIKDMAHILGLSENTVGKYRSRIRQKTQTSDIYSLIKPILR